MQEVAGGSLRCASVQKVAGGSLRCAGVQEVAIGSLICAGVQEAAGAEMEKAADAVSANFFQQFFCTFWHFWLIFAHLCLFLHVFFVLIFQAKKLCQCYFS